MAKKSASIETLKKKHEVLVKKIIDDIATVPEETEYLRINRILTKEASEKAK